MYERFLRECTWTTLDGVITFGLGGQLHLLKGIWEEVPQKFASASFGLAGQEIWSGNVPAFSVWQEPIVTQLQL